MSADGQEPTPTEDAPDEVEPPERRRGMGDWIDTRFRSASTIYGLIVYTALIGVAADHAHNAWEMLLPSLTTLVVFFLAHVFAHTLTDHADHGLRAATRRAVRHSAGMLWAAVPATLLLVIAGLEEVSAEDAYEFVSWITVVLLGVLGYVAYARRGAHVAGRLLGAAGTAFLGILIVALEYAIH